MASSSADDFGFGVEPDEPAPNCLCRPDKDGIYADSTKICDQHRMKSYGFEHHMRHNMDVELDERFKVMFGDRKLERSTATVGDFAVKR